MRKAIRFRDYRRMDAAEKAEALRGLAVSAQGLPSGELTLIDARIRAFETQYEMTSDEMRARVAAGQLPETADIARWLIALDVQGRLRAEPARR